MSCEKIGNLTEGNENLLDENDVVAAVLEGLAKANERFRKNYAITNIRYAETDTKPESIYSVLCQELVNQLETNNDFARSLANPTNREGSL